MADTNTATASNDSDQDWTRYDGARGGKGWKSSSGEIRYQEEKPSGRGGGSDETGSGSSKDDAGGFNDDGAAASEDAKASYEEAKAESLNTMSFLRDQSITSVPDGAETIPSDVFVDADGDGVTDYCRVGVPAFSSPPPPKIPRLPNLTKWERLAESEFADAFEKDPEKMVDAYEALMETKGKSGTYETDAAKAISRFWNDDDQEIQASKRGVFNTALHQTANAIVKKAFLRRLDSMKPGDQIMVTNGGVGSGKGHSLGSVDEAIAMKGASGAVWDSAGDQNATENPWILAEAKKRGLKVNFMFVHANPNDVWSNPDFGVIKRAKDPKDGRMVDAAVFVDSYAIGARNHFAFMQRNSNDPDVNFITLDNYARPKMGDDGQPVMENGKPKMASTPKMVKGFPQDAMAVNRDELYQFAVASIHQMDDVPERIKYGALMGSRVWPGEFVKEKTEKKMSTLGLVRYTKRLEWNRRGSGSGWSRYF